MEGGEQMSALGVALYSLGVVFLVLGSGLMSGLTLGLLSLDVMDLEVLRVSGTTKQQSAASRLIPLVAKPHWLLCTLLLCNAACMEALPLFLDRLLNPVGAILLSVTAILLFGEIIPQAVCSRYGVAIGSALAPLVRVLMLLCSPITWPLGKLLDLVLGHENVAMKRQQLKAMVQLHGEHAGLGGKLTAQEVSVISGAIDLRYKTAIGAMTPLSKVFMVSDQALLDEGLVRAMLHSGHSRVPVYRGNDPSDFAGLILVKEVLQFWRCPETPRVSQLSLRPFPRLPADTPMFDMLRFFQTGNSHMALLTAPEGSDLEEFKRTRAFMMTRDEDDSSSSTSSSSSSSESCSSSDDEAAPGTRSTTGSISSSIRWHLRRRKSSKQPKASDGRNSVDSILGQSSVAGSDVICVTTCGSSCTCTCHSQPACLCDEHVAHRTHDMGSAGLSTGLSGGLSAGLSAGFSPQLLDMQTTQLASGTAKVGSHALMPLQCSGSMAASLASPTPSPGIAAAAGGLGESSPDTSSTPGLPAASNSSSSSGPPGYGCLDARSSLHASPLHASTADVAAQQQHHHHHHQQQQQGPCRSPFAAAPDAAGHEVQLCDRCHCPIPLHMQQLQQQQMGPAVSPSGPVSHPVEVHHHHHHTHHHHQQQQQQQQWGVHQQHHPGCYYYQHHQQQLGESAVQSASSGHVSLAVAPLELSQVRTVVPLLVDLHHSSSGSGDSSCIGAHTAATAAAPLGAPVRPPAAAASGPYSDAGVAAVGSDETQDKLGPLVTHPTLPQQQQKQQLGWLNIGVGAVRQVPVGIITLEDVIEELMQAEIVDETDAFMDNDKTKRVDLTQLMETLPPSMLATLRAEMLQAAQNFIKQASWSPNPGVLSPTSNTVRQLASIRAVAAAAAAAGGPAAPPAPSSAATAAIAAAAPAAGSNAGQPVSSWAFPPHSGEAGVTSVTWGGGSPSAAAAAAPSVSVQLSAATAVATSAPHKTGGLRGLLHGARASGTGAAVSPKNATAVAAAAAAAAGNDASAAGAGEGSAHGASVSADGAPPPSEPWQRMRVSSTPVVSATAAGTASPTAAAAAAGGSGVGAAGAASVRMSAPGVLSRPVAGVKPVAKVFKSAPSPLLSPQTPAGSSLGQNALSQNAEGAAAPQQQQQQQ